MTKRQSELFPELPSDKKYVSDYPELVAEWHPTKNGNLLPDGFHVGSHEKVWWKCSKGHEWQTELRLRTRRGSRVVEIFCCKKDTFKIFLFSY